MRRFLLACLSLPALNPAMAADAPVQGVWQGTLGKASVVACFNQPSPTQGSDRSGSYYYTRYKSPIMLARPNGKVLWEESNAKGDTTGTWSLHAQQGSKLDGTWTEPKSGKTLPLALTLLEAAGDREHPSCASDAYNLPLEEFPSIKVSKPITFEGKQYRNLTLADTVTLELIGAGLGDGVTKINAQLRAVLAKNRQDLADFFATRREYLGRNGFTTQDEVYAEPSYWSSRWVTLRFYRWPAGYGANGISIKLRTWDVKTGQETDVWHWFGASASDGDDKAELPDRLRQALFKEVKIDAGCKNTDYDGRGRFHLSLKPEGVSFWEDANGSGCENDFLLPYDKAGPFLSAKGHAALSDLLPKN
ncbi:hypothetical protein [Janthinobacterium sp. HLX7-2]|uniref:hypothetical protein n=1 Tax=Janthinobacterium sp. HLX7-2 TaxID=1259331 RepID=UPI003F1F6FC4